MRVLLCAIRFLSAGIRAVLVLQRDDVDGFKHCYHKSCDDMSEVLREGPVAGSTGLDQVGCLGCALGVHLAACCAGSKGSSRRRCGAALYPCWGAR